MAHTGIFATSDEILVKAGEHYDISITEARINALCLQIENYINVRCEYNFSDNFASLNVDVKYLLSQAASDLIAIYMIIYNMTGYTGIGYAEDMINVLNASAEKSLKLLEDKDKQSFMAGA